MTPDELQQIAAGGESETVEFKESLQDEALQTVGAFASTRGGTLLIGANDSGDPKRPQSPLVQATVHCGRFYTDTDIRDDRLIEGSIVDQIDETLDFIKKHINVRFVITGKPRRDQIWDYPLEALREAVVNAICHRDYGDSADIQVKVFDDHIRIWNPGFLPFGVTIEDLYRRTHPSKPRNKLVAQVFYDLEIIERYGSGIQRMLDACKSAGLPEPTLEESTGGFLITFRKAASAATETTTPRVAGEVGTQLALSRHQVLIIEKCLEEKPLTDLMTIAGRSDRTKFRHHVLKPLLDGGLIEMTIPGKPRSSLQRYRLTDKGRAWLANHTNQEATTGK